MADDPFALSPISARPTLPTEADYEAICEAFMETSRGRWFLSEYASRNRHSDTRTVLDAVERIEATLARQQLARAALSDAVLGGIAEAVGKAKGRALGVRAADSAVDPLAGVRRAAQVIRDVSWTLRECGADTRICDLLDSQTAAIAEGCMPVPAAPDTTAALAAVFEDLAIELDALVRGETQATPSSSASGHTETDRPASVTPGDRQPAAADAPADMVDAAVADGSATADAALIESAYDEAAEFETAGIDKTGEEATPLMTAAVAETAPGNAALTDNALADNVLADNVLAESALADAAFDVSVPAEPSLADSGYDAALIDETPTDAANASAVSTATDGETDETAKADITNVLPAPFSLATPEEPASSRSLGAALVSGGLIDGRSRPDPLAALRKMSYAEKIALFS